MAPSPISTHKWPHLEGDSLVVGCLEPAYNGIYPDDDPSRLTAYMGFTLMTTFLVHVGCSEPAYSGIYPDGRPSRPTTYTGLDLDGDSSNDLLEDGHHNTPQA